MIIGGRLLVEYEIQKEDLQIRSENGISRAVCKVRKNELLTQPDNSSILRLTIKINIHLHRGQPL